MNIVLIGAGGHARNVFEMIIALGHSLIGYVDVRQNGWFSVPRYESEAEMDALGVDFGVALGIGGVTVNELRKRVSLLMRYRDRGCAAPSLVHPQAYVSKSAVLKDGCHIMAGAKLQASCRIGRGAIVNTGAIVEHETIVNDGVHVAPGAILLGNVTVGAYAMIGAGAVVLPGADVPEGALVKAGTRYPQ
jgi:sugar O-acyltransferase (sialic acid O-acetyltransferase NeuD family)